MKSCNFLLIFVGMGLALSLAANADAQELPESGKIYLIQSTMDGGLLFPRGSGEICKQLSSISFTYGPSAPYNDKYKWNVFQQFDGTFNIFSNLTESQFTLNEITIDNYPPFCYPVYRNLELISTSGDLSFQIRNPRDNTCLYSYGSEVGLTIWRDCNEPYGQSFQFIEI